MTPLFSVLFVHTGTDQAPFNERKVSQASFPHYQLLIAFSLSSFQGNHFVLVSLFLENVELPHPHPQPPVSAKICYLLGLSSNITSSERSSLNHYIKLSLETKPDAWACLPSATVIVREIIWSMLLLRAGTKPNSWCCVFWCVLQELVQG